MANPLFTLLIQPSGTISCTQPSPSIYLLTFISPPDNRLTPSFCEAFLLALDILEYKHPRGVVITTSGIPKFYSNGLDLQLASSTPGFWRWLWISYPMPTLSLLNGHAFAGGLMLSLFHDYRLMNPHRGYLCLNELILNVPLRPPMSSIFRQKLPSPQTYRTLVLEAKRFTALEALKEGIVDGLGGLEEALGWVEEMGLREKSKSRVYGKLKEEMWRETVGLLDDDQGADERERVEGEKDRKRAEIAKWRVRQWELKEGGKAKL
ncbi:MAG: hypothetical protein M1827_004476 [Pycnora praestabilis]|nr:MAG: hypothetical protein M1827_004476 [Pycnora praestabilis]